MEILHIDKQNKFIAYNKHFNKKNKAPNVIFLHGLMSNMNGTKALYIEKYCIEQEYNFIRYDNFGCGASSGEFISENISSWLEGLKQVIENLTEGPNILVASSAGAWTSLKYTIENSELVKGLICISAAPDFTEKLMWEKLSPNEQIQLKQNKFGEVKGTGANCDSIYPISYDLILDGRKHLLLNSEAININCPVHLLHGMNDIDVPYNFSTQLAQKLRTTQVVTKLIKDGNHNLCRPQDLKIITNSIDEVIQNY